MSEFDFDLFVIGAGSGGVRASRIAASHGARVAVAEEYRVGGTCVIRGCVPKKMLVYGAHFAEDLNHARRFGWDIAERRFDWVSLRDAVLADVDRLNGLYQNTLDNNKVTTFRETARISGANEVTLASGQKVTVGTILIATGAWPLVPDIEGAEHGITSNEVFHLDALPRRVVIVGGGYIANEFAGIFNSFDSKVTILNRSDEILRGYDAQIRDRLVEISTARGIEFHLNTTPQRIEKASDGTLSIHLNDGEVIEADVLLFAAGRKPKSFDLGLETVGVALNDKGAVIVDKYNRTNVPSIYAVGDVTDRVQLTPVAIREGHAFADTVFGNTPRTVDYDCIPSAVFSDPPMAGVGLTEAEAREKLGDVKIYTSDFRPMKNALSGSTERSLYKMICDASDKVVGLHMISPEAPEILQAAAVAVKAGLNKQAFDDTVALHPSMSEELVLLK
ncbi:MAG: glutathione-disulfide reductase [Sphingobium sp.]|nr:glutathione-disulfide reductase [Sphingobium sp.]